MRELREACGLSQEALAERAGLKYKHYQSIEAGRKPNVQLPTLIKIAQAFNLELWELLNFDISPKVLAEDAAQYGRRTSAKMGTGKAVKRRSGTER